MLLDIFKAFDKLWQQEFIYKFGHNHAFGYSLKLHRSFSKNRKNFVFNGQCSKWLEVELGNDQDDSFYLLLISLIYPKILNQIQN